MTRGVVSGTTYEPFGNRYLYELLGLRPDPAVRRLARGLPATNLITRVCVYHLLTLLCRITRFIPPALDYPAKDLDDIKVMVAVRTEFIDTKLQDFLQSKSQLVLLGAGWDTRGYNLPPDSSAKVFEIDEPATQQVKLRAVSRTKIDTDRVNFIACDFEKTDWLELLKAQDGFDISAPTFVVWEGVTMYLSEEAIAQTLGNFKKLGAGSEIVFDVLPKQWWIETKAGHAAAKSIEVYYGEKFKYYADISGEAESVETFLAHYELRLKDSVTQYIEKERIPFYSLAHACN